MAFMAAISGIEPVAAPTNPGSREQKESTRAPVDFGGAVTYREMVDAKLRVDPVSLAEKKRKADPARQSDPPPRPRENDEPGSRVDISV